DFMMIATMNPRERAGVEELSDVLLDRFNVVKMGYPASLNEEKEIILKYGHRMNNIEVPEEILNSVVGLVRSSRQKPWLDELEQPASVRASLSLYEKVQAMAILNDRSQTTIEDIRKAAVSTMASRIKPSPESRFYESPFDLINELVEDVLRG
ncbi:MAG: hypothetical protein GY847_25365, partial [Proteobacteria bacterium]|nr:hypothetical protein [Pseudomonadota bacterium]